MDGRSTESRQRRREAPPGGAARPARCGDSRAFRLAPINGGGGCGSRFALAGRRGAADWCGR